jgi:hypothetical protein
MDESWLDEFAGGAGSEGPQRKVTSLGSMDDIEDEGMKASHEIPLMASTRMRFMIASIP